MTLFDLIAIVTALVSAFAGLANGAVRELVGLFAFGLAVGGAILLLPVSRPLARVSVHPGWAATAVAIVVAFLVIYVGLQLGGRFLTARLRDTGGLGSLDRVAGGAIGLLRAGVLLGGFFLLYRALTPASFRPPWIEHATLLPVARAAAEAMQTLAPKGAAAAANLGPGLGNAMTERDADAATGFGNALARDRDEGALAGNAGIEVIDEAPRQAPARRRDR